MTDCRNLLTEKQSADTSFKLLIVHKVIEFHLKILILQVQKH